MCTRPSCKSAAISGLYCIKGCFPSAGMWLLRLAGFFLQGSLFCSSFHLTFPREAWAVSFICLILAFLLHLLLQQVLLGELLFCSELSIHPSAIRYQLPEGSYLSCHTGLLLSSKTSHGTLPNHTQQKRQVGSEVVGIYSGDRVPAAVLPVLPFLLVWHKTAPAVNN